MKRKYILIVIILILINFSCFAFGAEENVDAQNSETDQNATPSLGEQKKELEEKLEQKNIELEYVQGEISSALQQTLELQDKIVVHEEEIKILEVDLEELQKTIDETSANLEQIEKKYKEQEELLEKRLVALYQVGETSYLDVLLNSNGFIDFISNYYMISQITEFDMDLLEETEKQKNMYQTTKDKFEIDKASLKLKKAKKMQMATIMQNSKALQSVYISQLNEQEVGLREQIEKYKLEEKNVEAMIAQALSLATNYGLSYSGGIMTWPVVKEGSYITSDFGLREHPITGVVKAHTGIDISGGYGVPIISAADGIVSYAGWLGGYGNCVIVSHGDGISTLYGHGQLIKATLNQQVKRGDLIMEMGSTGNSTGPHLHFEVRINNTPTNPISFLKGE